MEKHLIVDGIIAAQLPKAGEIFGSIIKDFDTIIEIGYHRGAFSLWLKKNKSKKTKLICYDIYDTAREVFDTDIDFRVGDCFSEEIVNEIRELIQKSKKTLVLCDGGNKNREFMVYAPLIKSEDVIMLHDYHDDSLPETYESYTGHIWGSPAESNFSVISDTVKLLNLEKYKYDLFRSIIWGSFIKP
jgi:cephalosporin hydroxylase